MKDRKKFEEIKTEFTGTSFAGFFVMNRNNKSFKFNIT